jgi:hypothetical protein
MAAIPNSTIKIIPSAEETRLQEAAPSTKGTENWQEERSRRDTGLDLSKRDCDFICST